MAKGHLSAAPLHHAAPQPAQLSNESRAAAFASATPHAAFSDELLSSVRRLIKEMLQEFLSNAEQSLGLDLADLKLYVKQQADGPKLPPELFCVAYHLRQGIEANDADCVYDWLSHLRRMKARRGRLAPFVDSVLSEEWEHANVRKMRCYDQTNIRGESTIVWPILNKRTIVFHRKNILEALALLKAHDSDSHAEFDTFVQCVRLFEGRVLRGETSMLSFGAVWLRVPDKEQDQVAYWLEHLIHEVAHLRLESVFMHERLVLNPLSEQRFRAPIRDDPRPMRGVFHATFVLARIIRVFRRLSIAGMDKRLRDPLRLFELQFEIGMESLHHPDAKFSALGRKIRDSLPACCTS